MPNLREVLSNYAPPAPHFGPAVAPPRPFDADAFRSDLKAVSDNNKKYFNMCFGFLIALFLLECVFAWRFASEPSKVTGIFAVIGTGILGLVTQMVKLWKEKVNSDLLLILASALPQEQVKTVIQILLEKLK